MIIEAVHQILLAVPTAAEVVNDRKGDPHDSKRDFIVRVILVLAFSSVSTSIRCLHNESWEEFFHWLPMSIAVSCGYFIGFFNYAVNFIQRDVTERDNWWCHLNTTTWPDNWEPWISIRWPWRMVVSLGIFILTEWYYFS